MKRPPSCRDEGARGTTLVRAGIAAGASAGARCAPSVITAASDRPALPGDLSRPRTGGSGAMFGRSPPRRLSPCPALFRGARGLLLPFIAASHSVDRTGVAMISNGTTKHTPCRHGDCTIHYSEPPAGCQAYRGGGQAAPGCVGLVFHRDYLPDISSQLVDCYWVFWYVIVRMSNRVEAR